MKAERKLEEKIWQQHQIRQDDVVLAAVSGGADSVCLLLLLKQLQKQINFNLEVVHVEHGIRGAESKQDAEFVKDLCHRQGLFMHLYEVDVPSFSKEKGIGVEEAARMLRYEAFAKEASKWTSRGREVKVALAHHADDNAETILFQMVRGSGLNGLSGMRMERELVEHVTLIRPLLEIRRSEIEDYLRACNQSYCTDATNFDTEYSRNKVRREIIPLLEQINAQAVSHIGQSARMIGEAADYLREQAKQIYACCKEDEGQGILLTSQLWENYPVFLQKEVLYLALAEVAGGERDLTSSHVEALWELGKKQVGRRLDLPQSVCAVRGYRGIFLDKKRAQGAVKPRLPEEKDGLESLILTEEDLKQAELPEGIFKSVQGGVFHFRVFHFQGNAEQISQKTYTKWLNYDKIVHGLQIRRRRQRDYLTIDESGHTKKLKEYFVAEKIPQEERGNIWLLADESHIVWVVGRRISSYYKVSADTQKVLEVQFLEEM